MPVIEVADSRDYRVGQKVTHGDDVLRIARVVDETHVELTASGEPEVDIPIVESSPVAEPHTPEAA